jgi:hypothetical protein
MKITGGFGQLMPACMCGALLVGCAGGGSSASRAPGAIPAGGPQAVGQAPLGGVRRTASGPTCNGSGTDSFVGEPDNNVAAETATGVLAGSYNQACDYNSAIGAGSENSISSSDSSVYSFIGAGVSNTITGAAEYGFIGGGHDNTLTGLTAALSGGFLNQNAGTNAMLGAGERNNIGSTAQDAVIDGGYSNNISNTYGFIGAGRGNVVSGEGGVVGGGYGNAARASWATVPGGYENIATGLASFAAGTRSDAATAGAFVWSDDASGATQLASTVANQFLARASGGVTFWTDATNTVGAKLAAGSGTWASASDRNLKTDIARIDDAAVLDKITRLPINRWSYITERGVRHVGPMAQDFYAAFGVGEDDKHITSIDENGVALAAIKALHAENVQLRAREKKMQTIAASQAAQIAALNAVQSQHERQLERLSAVVSALRER